MFEIVGSHVKVSILLYLALRGGCSGRRLARILKIHPSQVFKALRQMMDSKIINRYKRDLYYLNPHYPHYQELLTMARKEAEIHPREIRNFLPSIQDERHVDALSVYQLLTLRGPASRPTSLSKTLRKLYG